MPIPLMLILIILTFSFVFSAKFKLNQDDFGSTAIVCPGNNITGVSKTAENEFSIINAIKG